MTILTSLTERTDTEIDAILDASFGTDRHGRTAYAIRSGCFWLPEFSYAVASGQGELLGVLQSWPVALNRDDGIVTPLIMVGPVAVLPGHQGDGLGRKLMDRLAADTDANADAHLVMIGDPEYYGRFWNFTADGTGKWRVPGPVEQRRLLMRRVPRLAPLPSVAGTLGPRLEKLK